MFIQANKIKSIICSEYTAHNPIYQELPAIGCSVWDTKNFILFKDRSISTGLLYFVKNLEIILK